MPQLFIDSETPSAAESAREVRRALEAAGAEAASPAPPPLWKRAWVKLLSVLKPVPSSGQVES